MYLATDVPSAKFDGQRIVLTVPSGNDSPQIAMTLHEAMKMGHSLIRAASSAVTEANREAEIVPFRRRAG